MGCFCVLAQVAAGATLALLAATSRAIAFLAT
jgi:hypothetical protein